MKPSNQSEDDAYATATVNVIKDMVERLGSFEQRGNDARTKLQTDMLELVASMRQDVHKSIASIMIQVVDHDKVHAADLIARSNRQLKQDLWLAGLTLLQIINMALVIFLLGRMIGH